MNGNAIFVYVQIEIVAKTYKDSPDTLISKFIFLYYIYFIMRKLTEKQHNLLDALGVAGGYTKGAVLSKVYVVHKETGKYEEANLTNLLKKGDLSQNFPLSDGDVVYFARNGMSFVNEILPLINAGYYIRNY